MKFNKITLLLAIMIISILAVGAVSAESVDDATISADDSDLTVATADSNINDVSAADDAADDAVGDDGNAVLGDDAASYDLDDDSYSTYFNEDGTATDALSEMGDYTLNVGTLTNKDIKIVSGSNINIIGKEGAGIINNGTIVIGDGTGYAGSILVSGLTFTNTNKNAVEILDLSSNITIKGNTMNIEGVAPEDNPYFSIYGVNANGYISGLKIEDNTISVKGNAPYSYGIQLGSYGAASNPENIFISNNAIDVSVEDCMAEAIYLDNPNNAVVEANNVTVSNTGDYCAYGIQISDSAQYVYYEAGYEGALTSARNILIKDNYFVVSSDYMVYGITILDFGVSGYDEDMADYGFNMPATYQFDLNTTISGNTVYGVSKKGVIGIGGQTYNMTVVGNDVTAVGTSAEEMATGDALGNHTSALCVQYNGAYADDEYFIVVKDNKLFIYNAMPEEINSEDYLEYVTFENNPVITQDSIIVNDDTYQCLFDEEGNFVYETEDGTTILVDVLTNKNMIFSQPLNIKSKDDSSVITNGTITLTADASGSSVTGLKIVLDNVPAAAYPGLAVITLNEGIRDVVLEDNSIQWVTANSPSGATAMGIAVTGGEDGVSSNIKLINNDIRISGDAAYMYGIDCYSNPWNYDGAITNLVAQGNKITLNGIGMVEGIYLSRITDSVVKDNTIETVSTGGNAYGIGTGNIHDVSVEGNTIVAKATAEGYNATGISLYESDINEKANDITVSGATAQEIKSDAKSVVYALVDEDNYDQYFGESGNYINDAEDITLGDLSNKDLTFCSPVNVKGAPGAKLTDVTINLTADASGSSIDGLTFIYDGASNIITLAAGIENINITNNNIQFKSTGYYNAAIAAGDWSNGPASHMKITSNNINVTSVNAAYGIDIMGKWGNLVNIDSIISDNNIVVQANGMAEGIYLTSVSNCNVTYNDIITTINDAGDSIGIAVDGCNDITISGNVIDTTSKQAAFGIANSFNTNTIISNNDVTVDGVSAIGIGTGSDTGAVIEGNSIDVTAGDYENTETMANAIGTGNSGIKLANNASAEINGNYINSNQKNIDLDGASSDTKVGSNYVKEYIEKEGNPDLPYAPKATTITVQSATVTADPNGKSKTQNIAITVKDANGNPVAGQTVQVYVNGALKTAKTNDKGVATLAVPYKAGGTVSLVASFNGATGLLGSSATGKLTVKKNAVKIAAKTKKVKKSKAKKAKVKFTLKVGKTALKKKAVTIKINKKTYKAKTNAKGIVTFKVKLPKKAKKYKYIVKFAGDNFNKAKTFKGKLTVK